MSDHGQSVSRQPVTQLFTEDQRKHLEFVQGSLNRMASASSAAKGWLLPVVTATYGYALTKNAVSVAVLGIAAVALFCFLDAHYLRQERAFRALHQAIVSGSLQLYDLNISRYMNSSDNDKCDASAAAGCRWRAVIRSWSIGGFYAPLLVAGAIVAARATTVR